MKHALAATLIIALMSAPALAHGGQYKGPGDAGGPSSAGGGNSAPPTNPGGAAAPGPGSASSGPSGNGPATGSGQTRGGSAKQVRTGGSNLDTTSYETWEFWWEANKDQYLNLKSHMVKSQVQTGSSSDRTGRGSKSHITSRRPSSEMINDEIIPTLMSMLTSDNADIVDSSVLALGRVAGEDSADKVLGAARPLLANKELSVRTAAALSLGVLGSPKSLPDLTELSSDSAKGRQMVSGKQVEPLVRALSALSMGLINAPESVQPLIDIVKNSQDSDRDLKSAAIVALGLMKDNPNQEQAYECLSKVLGDHKLDAVIKSYVPTSLGKLGDPRAVELLLKTFKDRDTDNVVLESAAIGLGLLATVEDKAVVEALQDYIKDGKDAQTRHFSFISLAEIGRRDREHEADHKEFHDKLLDLFTKEITKGSNRAHRSWAGLAGAIYARDGGIESAQQKLTDTINEAWKSEKDPGFKSAFAIALGLLNVEAMAPALNDEFMNSKDPDERGYTAVALGFLKYKEASETLRRECESKTATPTFRLQVATGLGLMGDQEAVSVLVKTLDGAQTLGVSSAVAKALGLIGDQDAVAPLKAIAEDDKRQNITRAFACVALGLVGEKGLLPWNARISADNNYRAQVPAIAEVLDIL